MFSKGSGSKAFQEAGSITTFMLVLSCMTNVLVALCWISVTKVVSVGRNNVSTLGSTAREKRSLNHVLLIANAFTYFAAMTASNEALGYVSYPTAVLAKSSKLIPTMIAGFLLERKSFSFQELFSAALITAGIIIFNLSRMSATSETSIGDDDDGDSLYGLFLLLFSLGMDGLMAFYQGQLKKDNVGIHSKKKNRIPSALECMLWINAYAILFMFPLSIWSGHWENGMKLIHLDTLVGEDEIGEPATPLSIRWTIGLLNITAAAGQIFIFFTIQIFSPLMCTTITTTRKFLTILLSVRNFGHRFTSFQWLSIVMVFGGLYLAIVSKFSKIKSGKMTNPDKKKI